jgi:hypothetical protein
VANVPHSIIAAAATSTRSATARRRCSARSSNASPRKQSPFAYCVHRVCSRTISSFAALSSFDVAIRICVASLAGARRRVASPVAFGIRGLAFGSARRTGRSRTARRCCCCCCCLSSGDRMRRRFPAAMRRRRSANRDANRAACRTGGSSCRRSESSSTLRCPEGYTSLKTQRFRHK